MQKKQTEMGWSFAVLLIAGVSAAGCSSDNTTTGAGGTGGASTGGTGGSSTTGGSAGSGGAGTTGGAAGSGGAAGTGGSAGSGATDSGTGAPDAGGGDGSGGIVCGPKTCSDVTIMGATYGACCPLEAPNECGFHDPLALGTNDCASSAVAPDDPNCPDVTRTDPFTMMMVTIKGCCLANHKCGANLNTNSIGCADPETIGAMIPDGGTQMDCTPPP